MSELHKFWFEGLAVRGSIVRLDDEWQAMLARRTGEREFAAPVNALLGEMAAAALLMHAGLKFDGALVMQIQGDGPVKLAVAEAKTSDADAASGVQFRCTATVLGEVALGANFVGMVNLRGNGRCAITLDPSRRQPGQQPYQGIVPLDAEDGDDTLDLATVLQRYMRQSEQIDACFVLAADAQAAAGLLVQRMPRQGQANLGERSDEASKSHADYEHVAALVTSLKPAELLEQPSMEVLHRLFWNDGLLRQAPTRPQFACTCSREKVAGMLRGLGAAEVQSILAEQGSVDVNCEFCGAAYKFDAIDSQAALASAPQNDGVMAPH